MWSRGTLVIELYGNFCGDAKKFFNGYKVRGKRHDLRILWLNAEREVEKS
jgi:hypothetical protein